MTPEQFRPSLRRRLDRWLGGPVEVDLTPYRATLERIQVLEPELRADGDAVLAERAWNLRERARTGEPLDGVLAPLFALTRELARRRLDERPYDEQILAGLAMHRGRVVEMQTGEGKTLAAVAPVALAALTGEGVHVLTYNDYLARRDAAWMGPIYEGLGLSVGVVQHGSTADERRRAYACDVTYLTAKEAGFDFLRDRLCLDPSDLVVRPAATALIDEADSILIDEARIPLVIAGGATPLGSLPERMAAVARELTPGADFDTDEHGFNIALTEAGSERVEALLGCGSLYDGTNVELLTELRSALHARHLLHRDVDYIVRGGRLELVDDHTGRVAERRQWPDGLQAALEAKERLELQHEGRILGSIAMQHFLDRYPRLCGMTGTATPAVRELEQYYGLEVTVIPPHRPCRRLDEPDLVFTAVAAKRSAVVEEIRREHASGRPVLVGTTSVAESEDLAGVLTVAGIPCRVLNARNDEAEAEIIAAAGDLGAVTISTNMAGRGTDIRLGGVDGARHAVVADLGGLLVLGTSHHASRRVDRQLRGRAGRQGDPGASRFLVSLEDPLVMRYGIDELLGSRGRPAPTTDPLDDEDLRREIARAQRIVEGADLDARRRLWEYSSIVENQREGLQGWRQAVLLGETEPGILEARCPAAWRRALDLVGPDGLDRIERRLTLVLTDRIWSDHLAELARIRDGIHVVANVGKDPVAEFHREAGQAFVSLRTAIEDEVAATFETLEITPDGVDWEAAGLLGPSATWTYLVSDSPFGSSPMQHLANRAGLAVMGTALLWPLLFLFGLWKRWRSRPGRGPS